MAQLKEIRSRISSIKTTLQVTNAMKMVSAAKLKKAQDAILRISPYDKKLHEILQNLSLGEVSYQSVYFSEPEIENILVVIIGANRGLCGGFNANVSKKAMLHVLDNYNYQLKTGKVQFMLIGKQLEKQFKNFEIQLLGESHELLNNVNYNNILEITSMLMDFFKTGRFQRIDIVYNKFKNAAVQILTAEQFLPLKKVDKADQYGNLPDYIFEPSQSEIISSLIPQSLKIHLYRILLDSNAAEQGARMTAMHQATDNGTELLKQLKNTYNNARQSAITNEIMEITAGAEALRG